MKQNKIKFNISEADKCLFTEMRHAYQSDAEKKFFEKVKYKEQYESAFSNELLVYEKDNEDHIFIIRKYFDTYLVGYCNSENSVDEYECETLSEMLRLQLDECVGFPYKISVWEWLRKYDYRIVKYNRNYDND